MVRGCRCCPRRHPLRSAAGLVLFLFTTFSLLQGCTVHTGSSSQPILDAHNSFHAKFKRYTVDFCLIDDPGFKPPAGGAGELKESSEATPKAPTKWWIHHLQPKAGGNDPSKCPVLKKLTKKQTAMSLTFWSRNYWSECGIPKLKRCILVTPVVLAVVF